MILFTLILSGEITLENNLASLEISVDSFKSTK